MFSIVISKLQLDSISPQVHVSLYHKRIKIGNFWLSVNKKQVKYGLLIQREEKMDKKLMMDKRSSKKEMKKKRSNCKMKNLMMC